MWHMRALENTGCARLQVACHVFAQIWVADVSVDVVPCSDLFTVSGQFFTVTDTTRERIWTDVNGPDGPIFSSSATTTLGL